MDIANPIEAALREAGNKHWCTKAICTTCGASEFRARITRDALRDPEIVAEALDQMDLSVWYGLEHFGGAIAHVFSRLSTTDAVDRVLSAWRRRVHGHTRIVDSVIFHRVRRGIPSITESKAWLTVGREEALSTRDPSLLETLTYALGPRIAADSEATFHVSAGRVSRYWPTNAELVERSMEARFARILFDSLASQLGRLVGPKESHEGRTH